LKQSLENEIKFANAEMAKAKKGIATNSESKATDEGDLASTSSALKEDEAVSVTLHSKCEAKSQDYEDTTKSRSEELTALANAKAVLKESTGAALDQTSFFQVANLKLQSDADLAHFEAVRFVRDLARKQRSPELAQLAKRMASAMRFSSRAGSDPFTKVKGLISDLISKLESDAATDASHKSYCDKELAETKVKQDDKGAEIEKLSAQISQMSARSAQLKEEVATIQKELAELAAAQADMDKLRSQEHDLFVSSKATAEKGLEGTKSALSILREYYGASDKAHEAASGEATGIIGLLEVVESDFSKALTELVAVEDSDAAAYKTETNQNEIAKTAKSQDAKYKTEEYNALDKAVSEATTDRAGVQAEVDALNEYDAKLVSICSDKAMEYEERAARRAAEVAGLKQALAILDGEAMLLQRTSRRALKGLRPHAAA
jgi:chromosome segregation ATPase